VNVNGKAVDDGDPTSTIGFTGLEEDDDELVHMGARLYDRAQYRFLSPDPMIANPRDGQSYNPYSYVLNNPLRYTDPTGLMPQDAEEDWELVDDDVSNGGKSTSQTYRKRQACCGDGCAEESPDEGGGDATSDADGAGDGAADPDAELGRMLDDSYQDAENARRNDGTGGGPSSDEHADSFAERYYGDPTPEQRGEIRDIFAEPGSRFPYSTPQPDPGYRWFDAYVLTFSWGPVSVGPTIDRHSQIYFSSSIDYQNLTSMLFGGRWATPGVSLYTMQLISDGVVSSDSEMQSFIAGSSGSIDGGVYGFGGGVVAANGETADYAILMGLRTPGVSFGVSKTWLLW
jgi:RHS repeat-associated protein